MTLALAGEGSTTRYVFSCPSSNKSPQVSLDPEPRDLGEGSLVDLVVRLLLRHPD